MEQPFLVDSLADSVDSLPARALRSEDTAVIGMWLYGRPASTQRIYEPIIHEFLRFAGRPLQEVTLPDLQAFHSSMAALAPATQSKKLSAIKSLLTYAHKAGYLAVNVGVAIQMPRIKNTLAERILSEDDVLRMIRMEPNKRNRTMLRLLYMAGLRREEISTLRVRDMRKHGSGGKLTVFGKGGKTRIVPLPRGIWSEMNEFAGDDRDAPLFASKRGKLSVTQVWRIVKAAAKRAGLPEGVSVHWIRHSHSSHALDHGCPIHVLQVVLGHSSVATTSKYLHVNGTDSSADYLTDE